MHFSMHASIWCNDLWPRAVTLALFVGLQASSAANGRSSPTVSVNSSSIMYISGLHSTSFVLALHCHGCVGSVQ